MRIKTKTLALAMTAPDGTTQTLIPAPPVEGGGCPTPDVYTVLDDDSLELVTTYCSPVPPGIQGVLKPAQTLSVFDDKPGNGTWILSVGDAFLAEDDVELNDWSLNFNDLCDNEADLSITKDGPAAVTAGEQMTYTITVENAGPANSYAPQVVDTLPAGTTYVSDTGGCSHAAGVLTCDLAMLSGNSGGTSFDVTVLVDAGVATGTILTNTATVSDADGLADQDPTNNSDDAMTEVGRIAAISVDKAQATADPIVAGQAAKLCYNVTISNAGPSNVTGLDILDTWTAYPGISWSSGGTPGGGGAEWTLDIAAGASINDQICFTVDSSAAEGTFTNTLAATGSDNAGDDLGDPANHTDSVDTTITRVATLALAKASLVNGAAGDVAIAGFDTLSFKLSVTNNGLSDVDGVVLTDTATLPAGVTCSDGVWNVGNLPAGSSQSKAMACTINKDAVADGAVVSNTLAFTSSTGGETVTAPDATDTATVNWAKATFDVTKLYPGAPGPSVWFDLVCTDGSADGAGAVPGDWTDATVTLVRFASGTDCEVVETVPDGYYELTNERQFSDCDVTGVAKDGAYACELHNAETVARFKVTKSYSDQLIDDVDVTLTCNTGLPLTQDLTISSDPTDPGVTFVVKDFIDGTMNCSVSYTGGAPGYLGDDSLKNCVWENVNSIDSPFECHIVNEAQPANFTVYKEWEVVDLGGDAVDQESHITVTCNNVITGGSSCGTDCFAKSAVIDGEGSLSVEVDTTLRSASCTVSETVLDSSVEVDSSDCDGTHVLTAGSSDSCTIVNTVFFEGIPTLSQYGLAVLALLMLGVGMVGFRRFA